VAIDLTKLTATAPGLVDLYKTARVSLDKHRLGGERAAVYLVIDHSRSMSRYFKDGSVQALALCPLQKLDLSHTAVRDIEALRGMELRELDLSHTHVTDLSALSGMPLERLTLNDSPVHDLRGLAGAKLKSLSLAGTAIKDLDALAGMPLTELDLRGCELLTDVQALAHCPNLEHVYLPRQIKVPANHWQLSRLKFIEYERHNETSLARK